jgi:methyl-accepting chemotaxis protein
MISTSSEAVHRKTLRQLSDVSSQIRTTSSDLSVVSRQTDKRVEVAQKASEETSMSVDNVVAASKKLSASINDISQRSAHGTQASQAARLTDGTVQGLAKSAWRIGEVVDLIKPSPHRPT